MRYLVIVYLTLIFVPAFARNYIVTSQSPYKISSSLHIYAGDTVFIDTSRTREICFDRLIGMEGKPIIIMNLNGRSHITGGTVNIRISRSRYLKITGTGTKNIDYGIKLSNAGVMGLSVEQFSDNIEVDHLEITNSGFSGITAKTDNYEDIAQNEEEKNFVLRNIHFHHNYIHHLKEGEGFYVGHNAWPVNQYGKNQHTLSGVNIHDNTIEYTPREAIQVGACTNGDNRIHHNYIKNFGQFYIDSTNVKKQLDASQANGIQLGQGFLGQCYNNWIESGSGKGIQLVGIHGANVYNNIIIKPQLWAIYVGNGHNQIKNIKPVNILYNTIISPGNAAIKFDPQVDSIVGNFYNNLIFDAKGIKDPEGKSGTFTSANDLSKYNLLVNDSTQVKFTSLKSNKYNLQPGSIAIKKAFDTNSLPLPFKLTFDYGCREEDIENVHMIRTDVGAYNFH